MTMYGSNACGICMLAESAHDGTEDHRYQDSHFPDAVGTVRGEVAVRFKGAIQRPRFNDVGPAQAFLEGLQAGTRNPEPEDA